MINFCGRCLAVLHSLVFSSRNQVGEEITKVLGFDWLMSFMQSNIHATSVLWAFRILVAICSSPFLILRYVIYWQSLENCKITIL